MCRHRFEKLFAIITKKDFENVQLYKLRIITGNACPMYVINDCYEFQSPFFLTVNLDV
jgi:hypothetical protein